MKEGLFAALFVALAAVPLRAALQRVPLRLMPLNQLLATFGFALIVSWFAAFAAYVYSKDQGLALELADRRAAIVGLTVGLTINYLSAYRDRYLKGAILLASRLEEREISERVAKALFALLDRVKEKQPALHTRLLLGSLPYLTAIGLRRPVERRLAQLDLDRLDRRERALRAQALATCRLHLGDLDGAEQAIGEAPEELEPIIERWLSMSLSLIDAARGNSDAAIKRVNSIDTGSDPSLAATAKLVMAHALASRGDRDGAEGQLRGLRDAAGEGALVHALHPEGPATPLARSLMANEQA